VEVWATIAVSTLGLIGTLWGAWLTYAAARTKTRVDGQLNNFAAMQSEIDRLREDLDERDDLARDAHIEITQLRQDLHGATDRIYSLESHLAQWVTAAEVLYRQLEDSEISPLIELPRSGKGKE